ncbi:MAG: tetratricopeptide repeat protein [Deltaproteobacteria bacterium]|nr:tetratricopeptide repeat protein [Deltaproteobacteria bacterium]
MSAILEQHKRAMRADPEDLRAFESLQEHFFMSASWEELAALYRERLRAPSMQSDPASTAALTFRLAQMLEERCIEIDKAVECYWKVAKLDPGYRPALQQLRQIHASREQWDIVLQIAEMESALPMENFERAAFQAEMGDIWLKRLNDPGEARKCFEQALQLVPAHQGGLIGMAGTHEAEGRNEEAAAVWEQLIDTLRGPDRAPCLVALGKLLAGPLDQPERASECYRKALTDDPRSEQAVEALVVTTSALEQWSLLADLYERRFDLAAGARRRTAIALEAGTLDLERLDNTQAARMWFARALELSADDAKVHHAIANLERRTGNRDALIDSLDQIIALTGDESPVDVLREAAELHAELGNDDRALGYLQRAHEASPQSPEIVGALTTCLSRVGRSSELAEMLEQRAALCEIEPNDCARVLAELGRLQEEELHDSEAATEAFAGAFDRNPLEAGVAANLERLYRKAEDWESLRALLDRALAEGPPEERCAFLTSTGELLAEQLDDEAGAARAFEAALEIDPESARALQGLERLALESGDEDAVLRSYQREAAITTDRTRLTTLVTELVRMLEERDRREDALEWAQRLNQAIPEDRAALESVARLRAELGQVDELAESLERLDDLLRGREQAANRRRRAALHEDAGRREKAVELYESALHSYADDIESLVALREHYEQSHEPEPLARIYRRLADLLPPDDAASCLNDLANLLEHQMGDVEAAIVVVWRLVDMREAQRPHDACERLQNLLERAGRYEELAQQLLERRRALSGDDDEALRLDQRRAHLLLEQLGQFEDAARLFRSIHEQNPDAEEAAAGLERALRASNDSEGLVALLCERAEAAEDPEQAARWRFERATLLEESLGDFDQAREAFEELVAEADGSPVAEEASQRLERLLERSGDWQALCAQLEAKLATSDERQRCELHQKIASLCRDRLGDREGCVRHLELAGSLAPEDQAIWHKLALVYRELDRKEDWLRVIGRELSSPVEQQRETALRAQAARLCVELGQRAEEATEHYERLLTLSPGSSEAAEFLIDHYERENRPDDVVRLLEARLATAAGDGADADTPASGALASSVSLRLRAAALRANELDDLDGAIDVLEPGLDELGPVPEIAEPLADLYQRADRRDSLINLCRRSSEACDSSAERASWQLRLAHTLRKAGDAAAARDSYRAVLAEQPNDLDAEAALRELHRELGEDAPLARLLEREIARVAGDEQIRLRMELAGLLDESLDRPDDALDQLDRVLDLDPSHGPAFDAALELAERLGRHEGVLKLLDLHLSRGGPPRERALLLERKGKLLATTLERPEQAITAYRDAIALDPECASARRALGDALTQLARWPAVLDCLYLDARACPPAERADIIERAVEIAMEQLTPDAALPWLERLRAERPKDPDVVGRMAEVHRQAGRPEALLRALEQQSALLDNARLERDVHLERARVLERDLHATGRALAALEAARALDPAHAGILKDLDRLYGILGRVRERAEIIEARIEQADPSERSTLHHTAAVLWTRSLSDPERAIPHMLHAVAHAPEASEERIGMLQELQEQLRATHRMGAWIRAAEAELAAHDPSDGRDRERINQLRVELAMGYDDELGDRDAALRQLRAVMETWKDVDAPQEVADAAQEVADALPSQNLDTVEAMLIDHLRADRNHFELEQRLTQRLSRIEGDAQSWLELARLRDERLHAPCKAEAAYREALAREPGSLAAIHGLRSVCERRGDWSGVAESLDLELARPGSSSGRAALLRRLGDLALQRLDSCERASVAYAEVIEDSPEDLHCLRALQQIRERCGEHVEAVDLYEREIEILDAAEFERRQTLWLRVGELARDHAHDARRALKAYEEAAAIGDLEAVRLREWAELYRDAGDTERFVQVWSSWCSDPESGASSADHLALVDILEELGRCEDALTWTQRAIDVDDDDASAWDRSARLLEECNRIPDAVKALSRAAQLLTGTQAAERLMHAARLVDDPDDNKEAAMLLQRATEHDPGSAAVQALLARVACELERWELAEEAAGRALDLNGGTSELDRDQVLATALAGGSAARSAELLESAARFYSTALSLEPQHAEALEAQGELLFQLGDVASARQVMEKRLGLPGDDPNRAHHLAIVAMGYEHEDNPEPALDHFRQALDADPTLDEAHEGIVRIHESAGRIDEALDALHARIEVQSDSRPRAMQLLHAARLELTLERSEEAEAHLRKAVTVDPLQADAWILLTQQLQEQERWEEALESASEGMSHCDDPKALLSLSEIRARALESREDPRGAAEAWAEVIRRDPSCCEGALNRARLLRGLGEWGEAADTLEDFAKRYPDRANPLLARVHYKRGRLLAGPLEEVQGAIECYERALSIDPDFSRARGPLASLLGHLPERHADAIAQHRLLIAAGPCSQAPMRSLVRLAQQRGQQRTIDTGLTILRALGWTSPGELDEAPTRLSMRLSPPHRFADETWEKLRRAAAQTAQELSQVLTPMVEAAPPAQQTSQEWEALCPGLDAYWDTLRGAEAELSAPGFEQLSWQSVAAALRGVAALSLDGNTAGMEKTLVDSLERGLGRRARRKVRKILEGLDCRDVDAIDWEAWRSELRSVAASFALDRCDGDLRAALVALATSELDEAPNELSESADIGDLVAGSPTACRLLQRVTLAWCEQLELEL